MPDLLQNNKQKVTFLKNEIRDRLVELLGAFAMLFSSAYI